MYSISCVVYCRMTIGSVSLSQWWTTTQWQCSCQMTVWSSWSRRRLRSSERLAMGQKLYSSQKEIPKAHWRVLIPIRKCTRSGTGRGWKAVNLPPQRKAQRLQPRWRMLRSLPPGIWRRWQLLLTTNWWQIPSHKRPLQRCVGTWIVPPPITLVEVKGSSCGMWDTPSWTSGRFTIALGG